MPCCDECPKCKKLIEMSKFQEHEKNCKKENVKK